MQETSKFALHISPSFSGLNVSIKFEEYREKVAGTNIDQRSLLSTDYFNTFNSVVMLFDMLPEMPELLEEVEQWQFYDYVQHFEHSGLDFANLAIEAYAHCPPELKIPFEAKIASIANFITDNAKTLRHLLDAQETKTFAAFSLQVVIIFRQMMEEGNAIVHGASSSLSQSAIDDLF